MKEKDEYQDEKKLVAIEKEFPFVAEIRRMDKKKIEVLDGQLDAPSWTKVVVQIADIETMGLKASNVGLSLEKSSYLGSSRKPDLRGRRWEHLCAVGKDGNIIRRLYWRPGEFEKKAKDIFRYVDPESVAYLVWVTSYEWRNSPTEEMQERGKVFGDVVVERELFITINKSPRGLSFADLAAISVQQDKLQKNAYKRFPRNRPDFPAIHQALKKGCRMHAFLSGGGLRVVDLELGGKRIAYGEHPHIEEALMILEEDFIAGGRPYEKVYGKKYPHYLTGSSQPTSNIDAWLRRGYSFDCWQEGDEIIFQLKGYNESKSPQEIEIFEFVKKTGMPKEWEDARGFILLSYPSERGGVCTKIVKKPEGKRDPWMYEITKTGRAKSFWKAMMLAFRAPEIEVVND